MSELLVVEDDANLRMALRDNLEDEGHTVVEAPTLAAADRAAGERRFDLIVLDVMLPDGDGYTWCRRLRAGALGCGASTPVLMLTARALEDDLVTGLDAGADDYLTKPYRLRELLARVRALLRRPVASAVDAPPKTSPARGPDRLRFGGFILDRLARTLTGPDALVSLTRTEFDLLAWLATHPGQVMDRDALLDAVWGEVVVDPRTVDNFVSSLKKKLGWRRGSGWRIATVRGVGYRWEND